MKDRSTLAALLFAVVGIAGVGVLQPELARQIHKVNQRDDAYVLPPPSQIRALSFGYRAAMTDLLWAKLLVENGTHWAEHRGFPDVTRYVEAIIGVEPDFQTIYLYCDTIVLYLPGGANEGDVYKVRKFLERGTRERPYDPEVWLHYGQFTAFFAPSFLKDEREIEQWRKDGAFALMHAVDLGANTDRSLAAATILDKAGERDAAVKGMERKYALTDDPEERRQILGKLNKLRGSFDAQIAVDAVEHEWQERWPFLPRGTALLIGPPRPADLCAGPQAFERKGCPQDWAGFIAEGR
jgi:hypothetical protein